MPLVEGRAWRVRGTVEKRIVTKDEEFDQAAAQEALPNRQY